MVALLSAPRLLQPKLPLLDRQHLLAVGLKGLVWMGDGRPVDLVTRLYATQSGAIEKAQSRGLAQTITTGGSSNGVYYGRLANPAWAITGALSFFAFFDHVTPASSLLLAGYNSGGAKGYGIEDRFGARTREVFIQVSSNLAASSGTWVARPSVRGLTWDGATLTGFDDGASFATASGSGSVVYDGTFDHLGFLGNPDQFSAAGHGYWMAVWNRALSKAEVALLSAYPFILFFAERGRTVSASASTLYTLSLSASSSASAAVRRDPALIRAASSAATAAILRAAASAKAATSNGTAAKIAAVSVVHSASAAGSASIARAASVVPGAASSAVSSVVVRAAAIVRSAAASCSATLNTLKAQLLALSASTSTSAAVQRAAQAVRSATAGGAALVVNAVAATRAAAGVCTGTVVRAAGQARAAGATCGAAAERAVAAVRSASSTGTAAVASIKVRLVTLAASVAVTASVVRSVSILRTGTNALAAVLTKITDAVTRVYASLTAGRRDALRRTGARRGNQASGAKRKN